MKFHDKRMPNWVFVKLRRMEGRSSLWGHCVYRERVITWGRCLINLLHSASADILLLAKDGASPIIPATDAPTNTHSVGCHYRHWLDPEWLRVGWTSTPWSHRELLLRKHREQYKLRTDRQLPHTHKPLPRRKRMADKYVRVTVKDRLKGCHDFVILCWIILKELKWIHLILALGCSSQP